MEDKVSFNRSFYDEHWRQSWKASFMYDPISKKKIATFVLKQIGFLDKKKRILDIGFGFGLILFTFDRSASLSGVELATSAVEFAKQKAQKRGYSSCDFRYYAGEGALPFARNEFDLIICSHVLEHVPDDEFLMLEIKRMLKPNGVAFLNVPINEEHFPDPRHVRKYTTASIIHKLKSKDFEVIHTYEGDRLWNTFGWFFEKDYHNKVPIVGFLVSSLVNVSASLIPFSFQKWFEERFLRRLNARQFAVCVSKKDH